MRSKHRFFTMLELMVAVLILATAAGALFWRIHALVERSLFESDALRFRSLLMTSRMLAINTQSDWQLHALQTAKGWDLLLTCREDFNQQPVRSKLSSLKIEFESCVLQQWVLDFYSSGRIAPQGVLILTQNKKGTSLRRELRLPELFHQKEGKLLGPLHPKDLERA